MEPYSCDLRILVDAMLLTSGLRRQLWADRPELTTPSTLAEG